jgi:hypothetical protein
MFYKKESVSMSFKRMSEYKLWTADKSTITQACRQFDMV